MCPVPTIQLLVRHHRAHGGIAITASHNPAEWNALKFIGQGGFFLNTGKPRTAGHLPSARHARWARKCGKWQNFRERLTCIFKRSQSTGAATNAPEKTPGFLDACNGPLTGWPELLEALGPNLYD